MKTTLNKIREHLPCDDGWKKLLKHLGKTKADDEPLAIMTILDLNGLDDALWCLRAVEGHDKEIRQYAMWCAKQLEQLMTAEGSLESKKMAKWAAAWAAGWDAAGNDAWGAAGAAKGIKAWTAEGDDARAAQEQELRRVLQATGEQA